MRTGRVRIGTSDTNCAYVLPPIVKAFKSDFPGVEILLTDRPSTQVVRLVVDADVDFGLATLPVREHRVETTALFQRQDVLICGSKHPLSKRKRIQLKGLEEFPLLMLGQGSTSRGLLDRAFGESGVVPNVSMELGSIEVIKRFVEFDLGVAVVPEVAIKEELRQGRLHAIQVTGLVSRTVGFVQRLKGHLSPAARMFHSYLQQHFSDQSKPNSEEKALEL